MSKFLIAFALFALVSVTLANGKNHMVHDCPFDHLQFLIINSKFQIE